MDSEPKIATNPQQKNCKKIRYFAYAIVLKILLAHAALVPTLYGRGLLLFFCRKRIYAELAHGTHSIEQRFEAGSGEKHSSAAHQNSIAC